MRQLFTAAALLAAASLSHAGDKNWNFKTGQTYTYTCKTEFHYVAVGLASVGRGSSRGGGWSEGSESAPSDPQWEEVRLRASVLAVGDDGAARIEFFVEHVSMEIRFDSNGDQVKWSSKTSPECPISGLQGYEALLHARFEAVIGPDGAVRSIDAPEWPEGDVIEPARGHEREERAALAAKEPTSPETWLSMIFTLSPERVGKWNRSIRFPAAHKVDVRFDGKETCRNTPCMRSKFRSSKVQPTVEVSADEGAPRPRRVGRTLEQVSMDNLMSAEKRGNAWFSRGEAALIKAEMEANSSTSMGGSIVSARITWSVEIAGRGKVGPAYGPEPPPDYEPPVNTPSGHSGETEAR